MHRMPLSRTPNADRRKRSVSESDSDRISSAVRLLDQDTNPQIISLSPPLRDIDNLELTRSNPNISPLGSGMIETPLGVGLGTRFQARNNPRALEQQSRAEKMCKDLFRDLDIWIPSMKSSPPPELLVIVEGYERFKRRIQRSSEEAILRRLSTQYTFQLSDYLVQLQTLKKRAERRERRDLNNLISRPSTSTDESGDEEENVFYDNIPPPDNPGDNIQSDADNILPPPVEHVEPEPEKEKGTANSGKSPLSKSLNDIIHVVKNSHQGEGIHYNKIETRIKSLEDSLSSITKLCSNISQKLDIVVDNSSTNSSRITVVENRVDELDRNTKLYVDSKINSVLNKSLLNPPPTPPRDSKRTQLIF